MATFRMLFGLLLMATLGLASQPSAPTGDETMHDLNKDLEDCDANCMKRFFYQVSYSAVSHGVLDAMETYQVLDRCNSTAQDDVCQEHVRGAMSSIADRVNKNVATEYEGLNATDDLVLRLSRTVSNATAEGAAWVADSVIGDGVLALGVPDSSSPDAKRLASLMHTIQQGNNYTSPALNFTSPSQANTTSGTSPQGPVNITVAPLAQHAGHSTNGRAMGLGLGLGLGVPATIAPLMFLNTGAEVASTPGELALDGCSDPVLCIPGRVAPLRRLLELAKKVLPKGDFVHKLFKWEFPKRLSHVDPAAKAFEPRPLTPEELIPKAGERFVKEVFNEASQTMEQVNLQLAKSGVEKAWNTGYKTMGKRMLKQGYRAFHVLDNAGNPLMFDPTKALGHVNDVPRPKVTWHRLEELRPLEGAEWTPVASQELLMSGGLPATTALGDPILALTPALGLAVPPVVLTGAVTDKIHPFVRHARGGPTISFYEPMDGILRDAFGDIIRLTSYDHGEVWQAEPSEDDGGLDDPDRPHDGHHSTALPNSDVASATTMQHSATQEAVPSTAASGTTAKHTSPTAAPAQSHATQRTGTFSPSQTTFRTSVTTKSPMSGLSSAGNLTVSMTSTSQPIAMKTITVQNSQPTTMKTVIVSTIGNSLVQSSQPSPTPTGWTSTHTSIGYFTYTDHNYSPSTTAGQHHDVYPRCCGDLCQTAPGDHWRVGDTSVLGVGVAQARSEACACLARVPNNKHKYTDKCQ
ncbi:hypothetical protein LTS10_001478 [Elasticomyces elasticus]|nr:hypothetical protein LTS10_001478 [Elasticomyces elasticus]